MKTISKSYPTYLKRQAIMFVLFTLLTLIIGLKSFGQTIVEKTEMTFEDSGGKSVTLKIGDHVDIWLKHPDKQIAATILTLGDNSIAIAFKLQPYQFELPFENISRVEVTGNIYEVRNVKIILINNEVLFGTARFNSSEVEIVPKRNRKDHPIRVIPVAGIAKIFLQRRHCVAIGFLTGAFAGALVGGASYHKLEPNPNGWFNGLDFGPGASIAAGALLGATSGFVVGAVVGAIPRTTIIHGDEQNYKNFRSRLLSRAIPKEVKKGHRNIR